MATLTSTGQSDYQQIGRDFARDAARHQRNQQLKVAGVWLALLLIVVLALLQLRIEPRYVLEYADDIILRGLATTILVSLLSIALATVLAFLGALGRLSKNPVAQGIAAFYVSALRGTPLLVQIYLIYLGLPQIGQQISALGFPALGKLLILDAIPSGVLALSLNYGAYMTEIFRAGIESVAGGQWQAGAALGLSWWQSLRLIVLPQAFRIMIPAIGNQFIAMQKDSTLVSIMGVWEISYLAQKLARKDSKYMEMFLFAAAVYWVLTVLSEWGQRRLEAWMAAGQRR